MDSLDRDINLFAEHFGLGAFPLDEVANMRSSVSNCSVDRRDLTPEALSALETAYAEDAKIYAALAAAPYDPARVPMLRRMRR